jgi:xylan 1,4-beta-xylosidase
MICIALRCRLQGRVFGRLLLVVALATPVSLAAASEAGSFPVTIRVEAQQPKGEWHPIWRFFGADEPNYAYMKDGRKLLGELGSLDPKRVYFRTHNLLTSGDGTPALKWGSTGAYREDAEAHPAYDWTILDRIFDTYRDNGLRPYVEIGFMPKELSTHPDPYQHEWQPGARYEKVYTGWAFPPKDYGKWGDLAYEWTRHCLSRYGAEELGHWYWEVWNEANIGYWRGTPRDFLKLHDYAVAGVRRAFPTARVGGPDMAGGGGRFMRDFIEHCLRGTNYATGQIGTPIDFISFHAKGAPGFTNGHVQMGIANQLRAIDAGFRTVASYPELRSTPIVIGESDPDGCAACQGPQLGYRNGTLYSSYTAASFARKLELAQKHGVNLEGALTWAFEFEAQPYFAGFRVLASNGLDLPVLNVFRMFSQMGGRQISATSDGAVPLEAMLQRGVRAEPDVAAVATLDANKLCVMAWHYHDEDASGPDAEVRLELGGLPVETGSARLTHLRIDAEHSNAFTEWQRLGSPAQPSEAQYTQLERAGHLTALGGPETAQIADHRATARFRLPRQAVSLLVLEWTNRASASAGQAILGAGLVASKPLFRDPVHDGAADPVVVYNRQENKWFMFYTNRRADLTNAVGVSWVHGTRIGIAESADGGANWHYRGVAQIPYGEGDYSHWAPEVTWHSNLYHMFVTFVPGMHTDWSGTRDIVHLTSTNLLQWQTESVLKLASSKVIDPCVLRLPDGTWRLWYNNETDHKSIYYADSPDLYQWQDRGKAIGDKPGEGPKVFRWRDHYWMVVDNWEGLGVYQSDDALHWKRQAESLVSRPGHGADDEVKGGHPDVVVSGNRAFLFYFTHPGRRGPDARKDTYEQRRSSIQVVELEYRDGLLTCDRDRPTHIQLASLAERD